MNGVFGVGPLEMVVIGVLALIFIGPEKLPGVIGQVMKVVRELRAYATQVQDELREELAPLREEIENVTREVSQFAEDVARDTNEIAAEAQQATDFRPAINELMAPPPPRDTTPALTAPAGVHANGASNDADEDTPTFADYRPG
jgi:sec-independent protein translocase protein TatB